MQPSDDHLTPARRQYLEIRAQYPPDTILLYRLGDFYETFDDDAHRVAEALHITLTSREFGRGVRVPLAGIPYHALNGYLGRLLARGFKVAICEQLSEPGRGIVERGVVRVVTPGTVSQPELLHAGENAYLAAVCRHREVFALAYVDVTTGEFAAASFAGPEATTDLEAELARLAPAECLLPASSPSLPHAGAPTTLDDRCFEPDAAEQLLLRRFRVASLEPFGCAGAAAAIGAAGAIVAYLERTSPALLNLLGGFHTYSAGRFLSLDPSSRRNLDLLRSARSGSPRGGLLAILDRTQSAMGGRLLRRMLSQPLIDVAAIDARLDAVAALAADTPRRRSLAAALDRLADAERLIGRICQGAAGPRDCRALAAVLGRVPLLLREIEPVAALQPIAADLDPVLEAASLIERAVSDSASDENGRLIRPGFDGQLDALYDAAHSSRQALLALERRERERTGIRSLKVGYTRVFGYFIEVTRPNLRLVPEDYHHKQTLANAERFVTADLRDCEASVLHDDERAVDLESSLFAAVLRDLSQFAARILRTASALAMLDVYRSLADVAAGSGWIRPTVDTSASLSIRSGRHPVVESALPSGAFIANDCDLDTGACQIALITGPNMAGKSTYLRQTALAAILAQMGSFVPAAAARIGVVDRIFTRVGAQDDISAGASTFLVEMMETASILRHATPRSLVLLDEVGRGTGTEDGRAIAQAVIEYLHHHVGARTLFATHFHELTALDAALPRLRNFTVSAMEEAGRLVFLHRVQAGASDHSYGIQVARLAGIPAIVAVRAEQLLRTTRPMPAPQRIAPTAAADSEALAALAEEIAGLDVLRMSPLEASARLSALQERARSLTDVASDGDAVTATPAVSPHSAPVATGRALDPVFLREAPAEPGSRSLG